MHNQPMQLKKIFEIAKIIPSIIINGMVLLESLIHA